MRIKYCVPLIAVLFILAAGTALTWAIQSPRCWERAGMSLLKGRFQDVVIKNIVIDKVRVSKEGICSFENLNIKARVQGNLYYVSVGKLELTKLWSLLSSGVDVDLDHLAIVSTSFNISELKLRGQLLFKNSQVDHFTGQLSIQRLEFQQYTLSDLSADVEADAVHRLSLNHLDAGAYHGRLKGAIYMDYLPQLSYSIKALIIDLDIEELAKVNADLWGNMKGIVQGEIEARADLKGINEFKGHLSTSKGGQVKALVLQYLAQYMPQRQILEALIKDNADVFLEKADLNFLSVSDKKVSLKLAMMSAKLNLNMNIDFDINIDGGLNGLLKSF